MDHEDIYSLGFGIWWIIGSLVVTGIIYFMIYAVKIHHYRSKKGQQLDLLRSKYISGKITKDELIELIRELK